MRLGVSVFMVCFRSGLVQEDRGVRYRNVPRGGHNEGYVPAGVYLNLSLTYADCIAGDRQACRRSDRNLFCSIGGSSWGDNGPNFVSSLRMPAATVLPVEGEVAK